MIKNLKFYDDILRLDFSRRIDLASKINKKRLCVTVLAGCAKNGHCFCNYPYNTITDATTEVFLKTS